jgi:hypothetical protein
MKPKSQLDILLQIDELNPMSVKDLERQAREKKAIKAYEIVKQQKKRNSKKAKHINPPFASSL